MRPEIKVYIAAKLEHAKKLAAIKQDGFHINARWIDMAEVGQQRMKPVTHWQQENFDDIEMAHFFIMYLEPGDKLKGALGETFYAIRAGKKIWIAGDGYGVDVPVNHPNGQTEVIRLPHRDIVPWCFYRQSIRVCLNVEEAFKQIRALVNPQIIKNLDGSIPEVEQF